MKPSSTKPPNNPFNLNQVVVFCLLLCIVIALTTEQMLWGLLASLSIFCLWLLFILHTLITWINSFSKVTPYTPNYLPTELQAGIKTLQQQRQQEQTELKENLDLVKRIRSSLLALQDSVILLDNKGRLEWWNQSAEDLLRLSAQQKKSHIFKVLQDSEFQQYFLFQQQNLCPQKFVKTVNSHQLTNNNDNNYDDGVRLPCPTDNGKYIQCEMTKVGNETLLILYDVTRVQHLEQMRKDFVANVSHELRTPLTVLMGYIETFADSDDINPRWQRGFRLMGQQTKRMNSIVNDLLMLSRLENQEKFNMTCVDMPKLLTDIFDDAQIYNKDYNHIIDLHIDSQHCILGSETYLTSALLNLITNAIKYTPKGGEIHIAWTAVKSGCVFSVSDNGLGIAEEHIERLTERFYRVDSGRSRQTGGTGLGLAIVKHVLYQHEAKLKIESTENQGSTFKIYFPKHRICS